MATANKVRKPSRAAKMREYYTANPLATPSEVAKKFKTTYQIAYMCRKTMKPKKLILGRAEVEVANRLGIPTAEYAKQKAKILKEPKKKATPLPKDSIGGLALVEKENGELVYTLVRNDVAKPTITMVEPQSDPVNHPAHYKVGGIETIDFIEAKKLGYHLGNAVKYISRSDHKGNRLQDLEKAKWYIDRAIAQA
jgi:hypothetical protein